VTAIFLKFWRPREEWRFGTKSEEVAKEESQPGDPATPPTDGHHAEAAALVGSGGPPPGDDIPLPGWNITVAWGPYILMSILLMLTGLVRQKEVPVRAGPGPVTIFDGLHTNYQIPVPLLHNESHRDTKLHPVRTEEAAALPLASATPLEAAVNLTIARRNAPRPEGALFNFAWLTAPGTAVFVAALLSMVLLRMNRAQVDGVFRLTFYQMKIPIPTIACMLGLSYVTRYAGMDATLGVAFAATGLLYPFFAPILGWLGVFLTGTDAGSNALFGSLQKITATEIFNQHPGAFAHLSLDQAQTLIATSNSTGGVMGKMIDAQSICVATAATHQLGKEADIFKAVVWHSILLATIVGVITLLQAYVFPFTRMVP
jgi:lactate permease